MIEESWKKSELLYVLIVPKVWFCGHRAAVRSRGEAGAVCFWTFISFVLFFFKERQYSLWSGQSTCVTFIFLSFLTCNVEAYLWSALLLRWMFPARTWTILLETVAGFWTAFLDIRAQDGTFALCQLSCPSNNVLLSFFFFSSSSSPPQEIIPGITVVGWACDLSF